jgi:hypothetical protein
MSLGAEKYVSVGTKKRSGEIVSTPVWIVELPDGSIGFVTDADSAKVKRIANFSDVTVQPCDARGRVREGSEPVMATASVLRGDAVEPFGAALRAKYGLTVPLIDGWYSVRDFVMRRQASERVAVALDVH